MSPKRRSDFTPPPDTVAALFLTPTTCEFQRRSGDEFTAKLVTPSTLRLAFSTEPLDTGWLAPGITRWGTTAKGVFAVGFYPPALYRLSIAFEKGVRRLRVPMPALVFAGIRNKYYVWALKGKALDPKAPLFYAPLPNLNEYGLICFGANDHPDVRDGGFSASWQMFWDAPFSDHHARGRSRVAMTDVREHLLKLSVERKQTFPPSALIPMDVTLNSAVERLIDRGEED